MCGCQFHAAGGQLGVWSVCVWGGVIPGWHISALIGGSMYSQEKNRLRHSSQIMKCSLHQLCVCVCVNWRIVAPQREEHCRIVLLFTTTRRHGAVQQQAAATTSAPLNARCCGVTWIPGLRKPHSIDSDILSPKLLCTCRQGAQV